MKEARYPTEDLAKFLKARGIKQRWLADQVGVNEMQVSRWARGITSIPETMARHVATVLAVPFDLLFEDSKKSDTDPERTAA